MTENERVATVMATWCICIVSMFFITYNFWYLVFITGVWVFGILAVAEICTAIKSNNS